MFHLLDNYAGFILRRFVRSLKSLLNDGASRYFLRKDLPACPVLFIFEWGFHLTVVNISELFFS